MLEKTDYKVTGPFNATVHSPCEFEVEVPSNRGDQHGTRFTFTDGAGGKFKPKDVLLPEGQSIFKFEYTPKKQGNLVVSIRGSSDAQAPVQHTVTCTLMQVTGSIIKGKPYSVILYNPQGLYEHADFPFADEANDSIRGQHILDKHTVELHGDAIGGDNVTFTDVLTPGSHSFVIPVEDENTSEKQPQQILVTGKEVPPITAYDPQDNLYADQYKPRVPLEETSPFIKATPETTPVNEVDLVRNNQPTEDIKQDGSSPDVTPR